MKRGRVHSGLLWDQWPFKDMLHDELAIQLIDPDSETEVSSVKMPIKSKAMNFICFSSNKPVTHQREKQQSSLPECFISFSFTPTTGLVSCF